jgi:glyoxylase-like metal-dependent hydrolase (beta-lactamase superfamily II)
VLLPVPLQQSEIVMAFLTEPEPPRLKAVEVVPGISRMVAANPSLMTYHGTNTYFIEAPDGLYILDPGPAQDEAHLDALVRAAMGGLAGIIVSHHHSDHFGAVPRFRALTGAPVFAYAKFNDDTFLPDVALEDGDVVAGLTVIHTPGHASDHLCLARPDGVLFSGDHVMGWNSSIVKLPDGDMAAYCQGLERLLARPDTLYLPGHGPAIADPHPHVRQLLAHRVRREAGILAAIAASPASAADLAKRLYGKAEPHLAWAAERNVEAHLDKLAAEGRARHDGTVWRAL